MTIVIGGSSPSVTFPDSTVQNTAGLPLTGGTLSGPINVPILNAPSGVLATQNGMTGIAKAWVNFNGATAVITGSFNISSVTRSSTGNYVINFTTAMPNANYVVTASCQQSSVANGVSSGAYTFTTSNFALQTSYYNFAGDSPITCAVVFSS
jgi:hypothetical protein